MDAFFEELRKTNNDGDLLDLARRACLHGTPKIFEGRESDFYKFRKRIADKFEISFHEIYIVGSAKLGFSPKKRKLFDYESDIDIAIVSSDLFEDIMIDIYEYQVQLRENHKAISEREISMYHKFLEYSAMGWMRPDKLPLSFHVGTLKKDWFDFFKSISYGRSEVGNYDVRAGVFKSYWYLEDYTFSGLKSLKTSLEIEASHVKSN